MREQVARLLLAGRAEPRARAKVAKRQGQGGWDSGTPLQVAQRHGQTELAQVLLTHERR